MKVNETLMKMPLPFAFAFVGTSICTVGESEGGEDGMGVGIEVGEEGNGVGIVVGTQEGLHIM